jgi:glucoamylase
LRITQNTDPNDNGPLHDRNGRGVLQEKDVIDGGFLELVRYGIRGANDKYIVDSLEELDDQSLPHPVRVKYEFTFEGDDRSYPGWRRYGLDGYGEDFVTGENYGATGADGGVGGGMSPDQRGRVWPFFTGERAHYQLAKGDSVESIQQRYVKGMEHFANEGLMLPEQVFDGVGVNPGEIYTVGEGTNSATPLAWTHAEYLKLLRSLADRQTWDFYPLVAERYQTK